MITISEKSKCTGCYGCVNVCPKRCITMETDQEGFRYPKVETGECISCGLCIDTCPILMNTENENDGMPLAYAANNRDNEIRQDSSSGGLFNLLAERILNSGGVVFGARFDNNFDVVHGYAENAEGLCGLRGSKYVQSKTGNAYQQAKMFLEQGRQVYFSGTPCQIAGLKAYLSKDYDNLFCQDIVCHGTPSPMVWRKYINEHKNNRGCSIKQIKFRNKQSGWSSFSLSISFKDGTKYIRGLHKDCYMQAFLSNLTLRPSCYDCKFKSINRQSDITLADFWGINYIIPEMFDDKGTSLALIHSEKGKALFDSISDDLVYKETDVNKALQYNSAAICSAKMNPKRQFFFNNIDNMSFSDLVKKCVREPVSIKVKKIIKRLLKR